MLENLQSVNARLAITLAATVLFSCIAGLVGSLDDGNGSDRAAVDTTTRKTTTGGSASTTVTPTTKAPTTSLSVTSCLQDTARSAPARSTFVVVASTKDSSIRVAAFIGHGLSCDENDVVTLCFSADKATTAATVRASVDAQQLRLENGRSVTLSSLVDCDGYGAQADQPVIKLITALAKNQIDDDRKAGGTAIDRRPSPGLGAGS